jgi:DNA/RNA-binding domain of Phe-tRNA-synthetase-like protein
MTLQARSQSFPFAIDEALHGVLALGVLEAEGVSSDPLPPVFHEERTSTIERWVASYGGRQPADVPGVAETRALFHRLDIDPTKHRPSSEALLRRVLQGKGLPDVIPVVDVCNLCSLEHQLPLGLYDRDRLKGEIQVRMGREGESYEGIRKQRVNLDHRLLLADDGGPFGAPTSDSARTSVTTSTRNVLVVLFCPARRANQSLSGALERVADLFTRCCGASVSAVRVIQ